MHTILIVAAKEFRDGLRNRWVLAITLVFAFLAVGLLVFRRCSFGQRRLHFAGDHHCQSCQPGDFPHPADRPDAVL